MVLGRRDTRDIDDITVARSCEALGDGEIILNCIDMDVSCIGYNIPLTRVVLGEAVIPVIESSGAGNPGHFTKVFRETGLQADLVAGMFHRKEVYILEVKRHMRNYGIPFRGGRGI